MPPDPSTLPDTNGRIPEPKDRKAVITRRSESINNLKSSLTGLVILHHTAISYGGYGSGMHQSSHHPPASSTSLVGFNVLNQTFFMGSFFYLSGQFSRKALERKPRSTFIKDRLYRLGLPTAVYSLFAPPLYTAILRSQKGQDIGWHLLTEHWKRVRGARGPAWFTALLLVLDCALAMQTSKPDSQPSKSGKTAKETSSNGYLDALSPGLGVFLFIAFDFVWRIYFPIDKIFTPLGLNLGYFPQYLATYLYGVCVPLADRGTPSTFTSLCLFFASVASGTVLGRSFNSSPQVLTDLKGGYNHLSAAYAVWNNATGYLLGTSLLSLFGKYGDINLKRVGELAYPAFLVHMPVSILIEAFTDQWKAPAVIKTMVIGSANVVASWFVGSVASALWTKVTS